MTQHEGMRDRGSWVGASLDPTYRATRHPAKIDLKQARGSIRLVGFRREADSPGMGTRDMTRHHMGNIARLTLCLALVIAIAQAGSGPGAGQSAPPQAKEPSVDYWQPLWMQRELWGPGNMPPGMRARLLRQTTYMHYGVQKDYQGAKSTVGTSKEVIAAGGKLYGEKCASCHGKDGLGDGQAPRSLLPSPALLAFMIQRPISVDEYLLWSISEGGKQFDTEMPAFKDALARDDIWKIIAYMRAGFSGAGGLSPAK
jgi:mono/diheme cytochrome c family protein